MVPAATCVATLQALSFPDSSSGVNYVDGVRARLSTLTRGTTTESLAAGVAAEAEYCSPNDGSRRAGVVERITEGRANRRTRGTSNLFVGGGI